MCENRFWHFNFSCQHIQICVCTLKFRNNWLVLYALKNADPKWTNNRNALEFSICFPFKELHSDEKLSNSKENENETETAETEKWYTSANSLHFRLIQKRKLFLLKSHTHAPHTYTQFHNTELFTHDRRHFYSIFTQCHTKNRLQEDDEKMNEIWVKQ